MKFTRAREAIESLRVGESEVITLLKIKEVNKVVREAASNTRYEYSSKHAFNYSVVTRIK